MPETKQDQLNPLTFLNHPQIKNLKKTTQIILLFLISKADQKTKTLQMTLQNISRDLNSQYPTVATAINELVSKKLIVKEKNNNRCTYNVKSVLDIIKD